MTRSHTAAQEKSAAVLPNGTVTFLLTDIEGSTRLWEQYRDHMGAALARHDTLIEGLVAEHGGVVVRPRGEGDSRFAVFSQASAAVSAATAIQAALHEEAWPVPEPLRVRMALHTGEADLRDGDYYGSAVNRCARLRAIAHGGQVLVSGVTADVVRDSLPDGTARGDLGTHWLKDLAKPERVSQLLHSRLPSDFPRLNSLNAPRHNLPGQLSSLISRERELAEITTLLSTVRVLTLSGAGWVGKTRLALRAAAELVDRFEDGVWLADLTSVGESSLLPPAVAAVLGIREQPGRTLQETLVDWLKPKLLLLVLDNCEHLLQASAELVDTLLRACPYLSVLATSRQPLGIAGETIRRIRPLALPPQESVTAEEVGKYEAVQLLVERAQSIEPAFVLSDQNAAVVGLICRRLDGLPLAIELGAARVDLLAPQQIAEHLNDRFRLLVQGARVAPKRHQTLEATVDWSYRLLSGAEQRVLERLSVFVDGCTLRAAEAVCTDDHIERACVLEFVGRLLEKSLIFRDGSAHGQASYGMLETIRAYVRRRLVERGELERTQRAHAQYYCELVEHASSHLRGIQQGRWLEQLEREHANLRAAIMWAFASGDTDLAMRLGAGLWRFWAYRGHLTDLRSWLGRLWKLSGGPIFARLEVLFGAGIVASRFEDWTLARARFVEMRALSAECGDDEHLAGALTQLGSIALQEGDPDEAERLQSQAMGIRQRANLWGVPINLIALGQASQYKGDLSQARRFGQEALGVAREKGDQMLVRDALTFLGMLDLAEGKLAMSRTHLAEGLVLSQRFGFAEKLVVGLEHLAWLAMAESSPARAVRLFGAATARGEPCRVPAGASADVQHDRWRSRQVRQEQLLGATTFEFAFLSFEPLVLLPACVIRQKFAGRPRAVIQIQAHASVAEDYIRGTSAATSCPRTVAFIALVRSAQY